MTQKNRKGRIEALKKENAPTVLIVGGGINGISLYRELALQGVRVVMVERSDFCVGASSALSRMVHGGLRYMEQGDFKLVREALRERDLLLKNAPHYVFPLPTTVPVFGVFSGVLGAVQKFLGGTGKPSRRGALIIKVGLTLYDFFTRQDRTLPTHSFQGRKRTLARWPLFAKSVKMSATYHDAWISYPERLGLELIVDTEHAEPSALAFNYMEAQEFKEGQIILKDLIEDQEIFVAPDFVVNATGAWVDFTNGRLRGTQAESAKNKTNFVGGTKGSHLIVQHQELYDALDDHMVYYENQEGRVCILFRYFDNVLIGSTDLKVEDPEDVRCEQEETSYILASLKHVFPDIEVTDAQILYRFSGVRPLVNSNSQVTGQISREHYCEILPTNADIPFPIISLIGGKWTTFRAFGEQTSNQILQMMGARSKISTENLPIGGGKDYPAKNQSIEDWIEKNFKASGLSKNRFRTLFSRYGTKIFEVIETLKLGEELPLEFHSEYSRGEIIHLIRNEFVETLGDIIFRRTSLAISGEANLPLIDEINEILGDEKSWNDEMKKDQRDQLLSRFSHFHGVSEVVLRNRKIS